MGFNPNARNGFGSVPAHTVDPSIRTSVTRDGPYVDPQYAHGTNAAHFGCGTPPSAPRLHPAAGRRDAQHTRPGRSRPDAHGPPDDVGTRQRSGTSGPAADAREVGAGAGPHAPDGGPVRAGRD